MVKKFFCSFLSAFLTASGYAMSPPTRSVQVSPGFSLHGLGTVTPDGLGVTLTASQSTRDTRRTGTSDVSNPDDEKNESRQTTLLLDYRINNRFSAALSFPYVDMEASFNDSLTGRRVTQKTTGLGDIGLFGRFSFWKNWFVNPTREWLGILGVEFATGSTDEKDDQGNRLSATQQPGSGATDIIVGTSYVWGLSWLSLYGDTTYKIHGDRSYIFGDILAVNIGANIPFAKDRLSFLGEFNGEFSGRDESKLAGAPGRDPDGTVQNTGGEIIYFSPAIQWRPFKRWSLTAGVQLPIYQKFRGTQLKADVNYNAGLYTQFGGKSKH